METQLAAAQERERALREALDRIANRAQRVLDDTVTTTEVGVADYDAQVATDALARVPAAKEAGKCSHGAEHWWQCPRCQQTATR